MKKIFAVIYGVSAYLFFLGTFIYAIGFAGNIGVPKGIDDGKVSPLPVAIGINVLLLAVFALQHSVMARQGFKRMWTRVVPHSVERSTYVVAATLVLALLLWQWRPMPGIVWDLRGTVGATILSVLFVVGWMLLLASTFLVNHFELFGLAQVWAYARGYELPKPTFRTPGLYRIVRHPLYAGFVIAFWSAPVMTVGHLMFSIATTGYILLGIFFEERDLIMTFGQRYREYRQRVPMLIPFPKRSSADIATVERRRQVL
jgi:protein-S-isoprenylcysteine O-methyltransferase Ste14